MRKITFHGEADSEVYEAALYYEDSAPKLGLAFLLQGLATRWLANLPGRDFHPLDYTTLPGRTQDLTPIPGYVGISIHCFASGALPLSLLDIKTGKSLLSGEIEAIKRS